MKTSLFSILAIWALAMPLQAAQQPQDVKLPDHLISVAFHFNETIVDASGTKPIITRLKGSVEIHVKDLAQSMTISVFNPVTKQMEPVTYASEEIQALFRAIAEKRWLEVNPPPLPVNRRSLREPAAVASLPPPKP
jgi:hypothetical protein